MDLLASICRLGEAFDAAGIRYGLIGGLAMAARGVQRATFDLDLLLMLSDLDRAHRILSDQGYTRIFHSENVSHYQNQQAALTRVDILHAFRGPSLGMLQRADRLNFTAACALPVLKIEDLVGLKIQALVNNPMRALGDWNDIHRLVTHAGANRSELAWDLVSDYLILFKLESELPVLTRLYDEAHGN